jgi:hypothetical protein
MTTLIADIESGGDARKIADALLLFNGVASVIIRDDSTGEEYPYVSVTEG